MTKAHEALEALAYEAHNSPMTDEELDAHTTTVREALLTNDEVTRVLGWFLPEYGTEKDHALSDKLWKILGVTG